MPLRTGPHTRSLPLPALLLASACSGLRDLAPDEHVVAAPISSRANAVLQALVTEYGSRSGRWGGCMSDGCTPIWATQFGYRAGVRRDREDLIGLGDATAARQAADLRALAWDALFGGDVDEDDPAVFGFPALLVSGTLGDRGFDGFLFEQVLDRAVARMGTMGRRESAGLAGLLAASAGLKPDEKDERLALAREGAQAAREGGGETWRFLAWAAIARASGMEEDVGQARAVLAETRYRFDDGGRLALPLDARDEVLSRILSLIHGLADLTQVTGDPMLHRSALSALDHVFSDAYFDGRFLIHDRVLGPSEDVCSGCNFMALYLVDRLYGDSFVVAPLPALPERAGEPEPDEEPTGESWDTVLILGPGAEGNPGRFRSRLSHLGETGGFVFRHEREPVWIEVRYAIGEMAGAAVLQAEVHTRFGAEVSYEVTAGFDDTGIARLQLGAEPLIVHVAWTRDDQGVLSAELELSEELR